MAKLLLDSSVWISFLTLDDIKHTEAEELFRGCLHERNILFLPDLILAEILSVSFRIKPDHQYQLQLVQHLKSLEPVVQLVVGSKQFWLEFVPHHLSRFELKTSDALVCCYAEFLNVDRFYTFDKKLQRAYNAFKRR